VKVSEPGLRARGEFRSAIAFAVRYPLMPRPRRSHKRPHVPGSCAASEPEVCATPELARSRRDAGSLFADCGSAALTLTDGKAALLVRVEADVSHAWAAMAFVGLRFFVLGAVLMTGMVLDGGGSTGDAALGLLLLCGALTLAVGFPLSLWWRLRPGRVSYEVADGELCIYRGSKIVQRHPCADITGLTLHGSLTWHALTFRNWFGYRIEEWPELLVDREYWPKPRLLVGARAQPAILLWGERRCQQAQRDLREAVMRHGATLTDS